MNRRRLLRVELNRHASIVRGPGAWKLIEETTGRRPVWMPRLKGFSVRETTARDVIAAAERLGYDVEVTGPRAAAEAVPPTSRVESVLSEFKALDNPRSPEDADPLPLAEGFLW